MGLHRLHRETNLGLKPQMLQGWTLGTITLYMLNTVMGDVRGVIIKCWPEVSSPER